MLFNSLEFIIFWIAVVCVYYLIPNNTWRKVFLLAASYYFYACWNVAFLAILLFETALSYGLGLSLGRDDGDKRKSKLCCGIVLLLLPLLCFKYLNFILASAGDIIHATGLSIAVPQFKILLPVGISFYTFMAVGYVVDCYKRKIEAEKNILDYSLFIGFFPQIASGPIGRASLMLPQFKERHPLLYENIAAGAKMMLWGFFMKLVVGDRAGIYVDTVFGNYAQHNGVSLMLATFLYTIQIYCDFAGYSLIAIGTAKTMGYNLMTNFNRPYFSQTIGEFWRRWHISLSTWFRDYVYFPLGGSRCSHLKTYRNLQVIKCNFIGEAENNGYEPLYGTSPVGVIEDDGKVAPASIEQDKVQSFKNLIYLCKRNGVDLIFAYSPTLNRQRSEGIAKAKSIAESLDVPFIDMSCDARFEDASFFKDRNHLNDTGARVYSAAIAGMISMLK